MIAYFDSSALVKQVIVEPESAATVGMASAASAVFTAIVSRAEVAAALAQAVRTGRITPMQGQMAQAEFLVLWDVLARVTVSEELVASAERLAWRHGLRGYDAVQLAAAAAAQHTARAEFVVVTFDQQLSRAARAEGFSVWPGENQL